MKSDKSVGALFELLKAGLWEMESRLLQFERLDFSVLFRLAHEQSVVGLVAAGLEHVTDLKVPKADALNFAVYTMQMEQRNKAMNEFVAKLIEHLRAERVNAVLVKGQGIAQCYEQPLWRAAGDVDLLLDTLGYEKAKKVLSVLSDRIDDEMVDHLHLGMKIDQWEVELHGTLRADIGRRIDRVIDTVQEDTFRNEHVRIWNYGNTDIVLPCADNDVFFVFTHILQHLFREGVGLRQVCDWCRLLWTYRGEIDVLLLESRLRAAGVMDEWRAFAALAVDWLGMPADAIPFYSMAKRWHRKAGRVVSFIIETGNMGHNRDMSYRQKFPYVLRKINSLWLHTSDSMKLFWIFPMNSLRAWKDMFVLGIHRTSEGK